jgi:four helix bundle protein
MNQTDLKQRTKDFALRVIKLSSTLPRDRSADVIGRQIVRSATSVAANYRSACRARSRADFIAKMALVEEEADESVLWLELLGESELVPDRRLAELRSEANELTAIAVSSIRTARSAIRNPQSAVRNLP